MADLTKNVVSVLTFVLFVAGTAFTGFGIFKTSESSNKQLEESYIIPAQVLNGLTVMFLLYLSSTSSFSASYKLFIIVVLVGGMMIEIYLTSYADREAEAISSYVFVAVNFLIRAFFLIELVQGEWVSPITQTAKPIQQAVKETVVSPVQKAVADMMSKPSVAEEKPSVDKVMEYKDSWKTIVKDVKEKNPNYDGSTISKAWDAINDAIKANELTKEHMKEALEKIKNKDGTAITGVTIGGKRRS
jgi:hypothetical protein